MEAITVEEFSQKFKEAVDEARTRKFNVRRARITIENSLEEIGNALAKYITATATNWNREVCHDSFHETNYVEETADYIDSVEWNSVRFFFDIDNFSKKTIKFRNYVLCEEIDDFEALRLCSMLSNKQDVINDILRTIIEDADLYVAD